MTSGGEWTLQEYGVDCEIFPVGGGKNEAGVTPAIANIWTLSGRKIVAAHNASLRALWEENKRLKATLESLPADWSKDSSLATWFPFTAAELTTLRATVAAQAEKLREVGRLKAQIKAVLALSSADDPNREADVPDRGFPASAGEDCGNCGGKGYIFPTDSDGSRPTLRCEQCHGTGKDGDT